MACQYMPKIFHGPHENPPVPSSPPTYLMCGPLFHVSQIHAFQVPGFLGSRFFKDQVFLGPSFQGPGFSESRFFRVRVQVVEVAVKSNPLDFIRELWLNYKTFYLFITKELIDYYNLVIVSK